MGALIALMPLITEILQRVIPDPAQAAQAQQKVLELAASKDDALMQAAAQVMMADAASESWMARNARPLVVLWSLVMISFVGIVAPALGIQKEVVEGLAGVPGELWTLMSAGVGLWFIGRTVEKAIGAKK